tara:strand:+ start:4187 stop:4810 length:624 start_codon:yes stop_codon:yes gene_type:complete
MKDLKKSFLLLDLDGVIFDSKKNMESAWNKTSKKFELNIPFSLYFKNIGMPFLKILKSLGVKPNKKIYQFFKNSSLNEMHLIKPYNNVLSLLNILKKKKIKFSIVTSKDYKRSKILLKKFNIEPCSIHCPNTKLRGKPYPDQLLYSLKKNKIKIKDACFVGDTKIDFLAAKRAKITFIFAKYGYGKNSSLYKYKITNFKQIKNFITY